MTNIEQSERSVELVLRARDVNSGLDYQARTKINPAPVSVSGRVILGETIPDTVSLEGIEVRVSGVTRKTDKDGLFSVTGVPAGETIIKSNIYHRKPVKGSKTGRTSKVIYEARGTFELSSKSLSTSQIAGFKSANSLDYKMFNYVKGRIDQLQTQYG